MTIKYQVTVPKVIAEQYGIRPGDEIQWIPACDGILLARTERIARLDNGVSKLRSFDQATERSRQRVHKPELKDSNRGWTREDLYIRGRSS